MREFPKRGEVRVSHPVVTLGVDAIQMPQSTLEGPIGCVDEQMIVVAHEAIGVRFHTEHSVPQAVPEANFGVGFR